LFLYFSLIPRYVPELVLHHIWLNDDTSHIPLFISITGI
jgi:hypothetical protein